MKVIRAFVFEDYPQRTNGTYGGEFAFGDTDFHRHKPHNTEDTA